MTQRRTRSGRGVGHSTLHYTTSPVSNPSSHSPPQNWSHCALPGPKNTATTASHWPKENRRLTLGLPRLLVDWEWGKGERVGSGARPPCSRAGTGSERCRETDGGAGGLFPMRFRRGFGLLSVSPGWEIFFYFDPFSNILEMILSELNFQNLVILVTSNNMT